VVDYTKRGLQSFLALFVLSVLGVGVGYIFRFVLARNLSVQDYGIFYAAYALLSVPFLFRDLGLGQALTKFVPEFLHRNEMSSLRFVIFYSFKWTIFFSSLVAIFTILLSNTISTEYLNFKSVYFFVILLVLVFFLQCVEGFLLYLFISFQKHTHYAVYQFLKQLFLTIFVVILFYFVEKNLNLVATAYVATSLLMLFVFTAILKYKVIPNTKKIKSISDLKKTKIKKDLWKFGFSVMFISIGGLLLQYSDTIMLTFFKSTTETGIYNAAVPISNLLLFLGISLSLVLVPMISELYSKKLFSHINQAITLIYKYSLLIILPIGLAMFVYSELILSLFFGQEYIPAANALKFLVFGAMFFVIAQTNFSILSGSGKPQIVAKYVLIGASSNILLNFLLIPPLGILGAAITTMLGYLLMLVLSTKHLRKLFKFKFPLAQLVKSIFLSILFILLVNLLKKIIVMNPYIEAIIVLCISGAIYLVVAYLLKLIDFKEIKELISKVVAKNE